MIQRTKMVIIAAVAASSFAAPASAASNVDSNWWQRFTTNTNSEPFYLGDGYSGTGPLSPAATGGGSIGYNIMAKE